MKAFGDVLTVARCSEIKDNLLPAMFKDSFTLGQRGCFSLRLIVADKVSLSSDMSFFYEAFKCFWGRSLNQSELNDRDQGLKFFPKSAKFLFTKGSPAVVILSHRVFKNPESFVSDYPWILPIVVFEDQFSKDKFLENLGVKRNLRMITNLGESGASRWDGFHLKQSLFL